MRASQLMPAVATAAQDPWLSSGPIVRRVVAVVARVAGDVHGIRLPQRRRPGALRAAGSPRCVVCLVVFEVVGVVAVGAFHLGHDEPPVGLVRQTAPPHPRASTGSPPPPCPSSHEPGTGTATSGLRV